MKAKKKSVLAVKYGKKNISAVIHDNTTVWKLPWFNNANIANNQPKESYYAVYGDLLCIDKNKNKYLFSQNADFEWLKEEGYYPIAMVFTRGNFNIYGDCSIGCMCLNWLSKTNEDGTIYDEDESNDAQIPFYDTFSDMDDIIRVQHGLYLDDPKVNEVNGYCSQPIIPSNYWKEDEDTVQSINPEFYYLKNGIGNNATDERQYSPSFYLANDEMNPVWWQSDIENFTQQCNIRGKDDTQFWIDNYLSFNENGTIDESCKWKCCQPIRYALEYNPKDSNTKGEWYIPATGEIGIFAHKIGTYNEVIQRLKRVFGDEVGAYYLKQSIWASRFSGVQADRVKNLGGISIALSRQYGYSTQPVKPMIRFENTKNKVKINITWNDYIKSILLNDRRYYHFNKHEYIEIPKGEVLTWSIEIDPMYETDEKLEGEFIVENEVTLGITNAERVRFNKELIAGQVILADRNTKSLYHIDPYKIDEEIAEKYYPVGIVTIPESHNVYDTNEICAVGLKTVSTETPESGSLDKIEKIPFSYTIPKTTKVSSKVTAINSDPQKNNTLSETTSDKEFYIGTTKKGFITATYNSKEYCYEAGNTCVTPYANNNDVNSPYFNGTSGAYSTVINKVIGKTSTENFQTSPNEGTPEDYLPTWNVQYYKTPGTNAGDWFINGFGELVYFVARFNEIKVASEIISKYWSEEIKYNVIDAVENETLVSIVKRDDNGVDGSSRLYNVNMKTCKSSFENIIESNPRVWLPFIRFNANDLISL